VSHRSGPQDSTKGIKCCHASRSLRLLPPVLAVASQHLQHAIHDQRVHLWASRSSEGNAFSSGAVARLGVCKGMPSSLYMYALCRALFFPPPCTPFLPSRPPRFPAPLRSPHLVLWQPVRLAALQGHLAAGEHNLAVVPQHAHLAGKGGRGRAAGRWVGCAHVCTTGHARTPRACAKPDSVAGNLQSHRACGLRLPLLPQPLSNFTNPKPHLHIRVIWRGGVCCEVQPHAARAAAAGAGGSRQGVRCAAQLEGRNGGKCISASSMSCITFIVGPPLERPLVSASWPAAAPALPPCWP